jgi:LacI family transcriptional regulator
MRSRIIRIAVDFGAIHFLENYRANAYLGVLRYAQSRGGWEIFYNEEHFSLMGKFQRLEDLPRLGVRGIVMSTCDPEKWRLIRGMGLKAVCLSNDPPVRGLPLVLSDDALAGKLAAEHFAERGFRHLGFCGSKEVSWDRARWEGFNAAAQSSGATTKHFESGHNKGVAANRATATRLAKWLLAAPRPFAVLGADDAHARQALDIALRHGLRIPHDVAILGIDNNPLICTATSPALSSIELDPFGVGYRAASLLDELLSGAKVAPGPILLPPKGVRDRESTDVLASGDPVLITAVEFMKRSLGEPIGVDEIAQAAGVSRRTLEIRFREAFGSTVARSLFERRIAKAKNLLQDLHLTIDQVAAEVGFRTTSHFCARFRETTGQSPAAWRAMMRSGE